jgi:hypothetical protein
MGVYIEILFNPSNPLTTEHYGDCRLRISGREIDLIELMKKNKHIILYTNHTECGDNSFAVFNWYDSVSEQDGLHIETLKEEFPEWSHEFFERWKEHNYFLIR